jgi:hypothetical protein
LPAGLSVAGSGFSEINFAAADHLSLLLFAMFVPFRNGG